jgi:hypothetical protein
VALFSKGMTQVSVGSQKMKPSLFLFIVSCGLIVWLVLTRSRSTS